MAESRPPSTIVTHGLSAAHNRAAMSAIMKHAEATGTVRETLATTTKATAVKSRMQERFNINRDKWITREYGDMLKKHAGAPALHPRGMAMDKLTHLRNAAIYKVDSRQVNRLRKVDIIRDRMINKLHGRETCQQQRGR